MMLIQKTKAAVVGTVKTMRALFRIVFGLLGAGFVLLGRVPVCAPAVNYLRREDLSWFAKFWGSIGAVFRFVFFAIRWTFARALSAVKSLFAYLQREDLTWVEKIEGMGAARRAYTAEHLEGIQSSRWGKATIDAFHRAPMLWSLVYAVVAFILWAMIFSMDVASYAQGQVIPAGQLKRIQHLEGGIIREIKVEEGQRVEAGTVIAELEDVAPDAEVGDLRNRAAGYEIKLLRINALLESKSKLDIPAELAAAFPDLASEAVSAFQSNRQRYEAMVQSHESKVSQRRAEIQEARAKRAGLDSRSQFIGEQVRISEQMLKQKLTNEYEHLQLRKEQALIDSDRNTTIATQRRAEVALEEAIAELAAFKHEDEVSLRKEQLEVSTELNSLRERLRKPNDSQERTTVKAPVSGTIMTLYVKNKGAVVAPGGVLATLVPEGESLLIEAKLPIGEIGYVNIGELARLSIASGGSGFSTINARVIHVSPDAIADEKTGVSHYVVRLQPEELFFKRGDDKYPLRPGVEVMAAIITGQRSVMALLLEPFIGSSVHPLSER